MTSPTARQASARRAVALFPGRTPRRPLLRHRRPPRHPASAPYPSSAPTPA